MTAHLLALAIVTATWLGEAQGRCSQPRVDQESYLALSEGVYAYVGEIASSGGPGEWKPFSVRMLVGMYRRPLLLQQGVMRENDLKSLLSGRPDIKGQTVPVQGHDPKAGYRFEPGAPKSVDDPLRKTRGTVRVLKVMPAGKGPASVILEVCGF